MAYHCTGAARESCKRPRRTPCGTGSAAADRRADQRLPKHWWEGRDFESTILDPLLGSGPYRITAVEPGRSITLERVPDYWGRNLPVNRGQNNIDVIRYDCYRNATVAVEAFKAGEFDFRSENNSKEWGTAYDLRTSRTAG